MLDQNSKVLEALDHIAFDAKEVSREKAVESGREIYKGLVHDATKRLETRDRLALEEAAFFGQRTVARHETKLKQADDASKIQYIEAVIQKTYETMQALSDRDFLDLVNRALEAQATEERPRIFVDGKHFDLLLKDKGQAYQVIVDLTLGDGFVLQYQNYDVNMQLQKIFQVKHERLVHLASEVLFGVDVL